jgi:nitrite reductase/ring-hydroxylating ferredoxin subunit
MEESQDRRKFIKDILKYSCCTLGTIQLGNLLSSCEYIQEFPIDPRRIRTYDIDISKIPELNEVGSYISRAFGKVHAGKKLIIVRKDIGTVDDFIIYSSICPHGGATLLLPEEGKSNIHCFEHYSEYDLMTGEMKLPPDNEESFVGVLWKFRNVFEPVGQILTVYY